MLVGSPVNKLCIISNHQIRISCGLCTHQRMLAVANMITAFYAMLQPMTPVRSTVVIILKPTATSYIGFFGKVTHTVR